MPKEIQKEAVPSYSRIVDNSVDFVAPSQSDGQQSGGTATEQQSATADTGQQSTKADAGQQTTPTGTDVGTGQQDTKTETGQQATQPGAGQEKQQQTPDYINEIMSQLASINQQIAAGEQTGDTNDPMAQLDQQLVDLQQKAQDGEITYAEMIRQTAPLIEQRATIKVKQDLQQEEEAKQIRGAQDAFLAENPDFMEFINSPEAKAIRQANPILDNVSAYYAFKAKSAQAAIGGLQQQFNELKAQMEKSIKGAAQSQAPIVGAGAGNEAQIPNLNRGDGLKPMEGGLAALRKARATA